MFHSREPADEVVVVHYAESGFLYYGTRRARAGYVYLRSTALLRAASERSAGRRLVLATTFHRALRLDQPELWALIEENCQVDKSFPATVGDGEIAIRLPKPVNAAAAVRRDVDLGYPLELEGPGARGFGVPLDAW